jgi:amino acid permease
MAHYNAPTFYWQLKDRNADKYRAVVFHSFGWAVALMILIAGTGYWTFGSASQSLILNNYSPQDRFMSLSRWAVVFSLLFSYPLAFGGVRDGIFRVLGVPEERRTRALVQRYTVAILTVITFLASIMKDIRVVLSFSGATWGTLLSYVFPAFMVVGLSRQTPRRKNEAYPSTYQVRFAVVTAIVGLAMGVIGTMKAIQAVSSSSSS